MYDAKEVANFMLDHADERGFTLTNMELIKHIYFAHGWHLASKNSPLISNRIEAWEYGPVIRSVYECFKMFGASPISSRAQKIDFVTGGWVESRGEFDNETTALLCYTLDYYSGYGAFELSSLTHERGGPWDRIWNAGDGKVRLNMEIPNASIQAHFIQQLKSTSIQ